MSRFQIIKQVFESRKKDLIKIQVLAIEVAISQANQNTQQEVAK
ncbi:hypothetical protein [Thiomicrorhabdus indica]|nr:hypothetical protein [Thiomicrorhabdus indica]